MASRPSKTTTTKVVNNNTGVTTSTSKTVSGNKTTVTKTTTIGTAKAVAKPSASSASKPATLARAAAGSRWITGPNDSRQMCVPVAVANALLGATGTEASSAQVERLYASAGGIGDTGVPLVMAFEAARRDGLAGCRLKGWRRAALDDADVLLLGFAEGLHAAAFAGMTVITWGEEIPLEDLDARIIDAWSLTWHGQEVTSRG